MTWQAAGWVALGGAIGSVLRWAAIVLAAQRFGVSFPWGTLLVNVAGSFAIGAIAEWGAGGVLGVTPTSGCSSRPGSSAASPPFRPSRSKR
ncbi:hypothetical protein WPS_14730 [Vulcanimicrobium alpinum]|uniref:Fluoride-specific ion channel n=1 Tax=Vulcanimicrobium alpinum TaxID=3016050 RepID=A0AAN1XVI9_UNVUL|nr:hypothetical protein WPS_14730 [Vulcanimicrobium alpinum]